MKLNACAVFLLLICPLQRLDCSLPVFTPAPAALQEKVSANPESDPVSSLKKHKFMRLPGICRRLKRRRVTIVCNLEKFCWGRSWWRRQRTPPGQVEV
ncbi:uncharacterized protein V3H82_019782 [Fundulus diaphanus]